MKILDISSLSYSIGCSGLAAFILNYLTYFPFFILFVALIPIFYIGFRIENDYLDEAENQVAYGKYNDC